MSDYHTLWILLENYNRGAGFSFKGLKRLFHYLWWVLSAQPTMHMNSSERHWLVCLLFSIMKTSFVLALQGRYDEVGWGPVTLVMWKYINQMGRLCNASWSHSGYESIQYPYSQESPPEVLQIHFRLCDLLYPKGLWLFLALNKMYFEM